MNITFFPIAFELELLFDQIYSQQKKNNITLTAFDLFDFVLLITVYLITYRFSWQTDASYLLANISTFTYQEHTKQCLAIFTDIIFESHFIDLHCSAVPKSYDIIITRDLISSNHIIKFEYHYV